MASVSHVAFYPVGHLNSHFLLHVSARATCGWHWVLRVLSEPRRCQVVKLSGLTAGISPCFASQVTQRLGPLSHIPAPTVFMKEYVMVFRW